MLAYLFVGGVRSGKSMLAQKWAEALAKNKVPAASLYVATCLAQDAEMADRIAKHKAQRGTGWFCVEEPYNPAAGIAGFLASHKGFNGAMVLDCLGMWLANSMQATENGDKIMERVQALLAYLARLPHNCAVVSVECGLGFVPGNALARAYGDMLGSINQMAAAMSANVILAACGLPLALKGQPPAL